MNIGEAAKRSGVSAKMIRYYEDAGLIAKAARSLVGYRHFEDTDIHRLRFIHRARELGFSIPRIVELLSLWDDKTRSNSQVKRLAESHIGDLQREIAALRSVVKTLERLSESCLGDGRAHCPILEDLANAAGTRKVSKQKPKGSRLG